ncbi:MAG: amino acid permease [Verrucomicrobiales bacterium]|nr:amino acid permease [Verrucomicrobiales bacterium]
MPGPASMQEDEHLLRQFGYEQELARRMSGFSNFAISFSIICILAGGITSFHVGLCSVGGASIGLGWPLVCAFSLVVALTMAQVASAFPTAGGLYHWGSLLGGRACGWCTAWFNLCGLITVLAAINVGAWDFIVATFGLPAGMNPALAKTVALVVLLGGQAALNHYGIRWTTRITDFSGWLILAISTILTVAVVLATSHFEWSRLWDFQNFSGHPSAAPVFPRQDNVFWLFCLGFLLPAYTITGFDASAHTSEETVGAAVNVPRGIVRSVWVSAVFGWFMIVALLLAMPSISEGVDQGAAVVPWVMKRSLPGWLAWPLLAGIAVAQVCCALAALTSASRMMFAFARDGGLPFSRSLRTVNRRTQSPSIAVWTCAITCGAMIVLLRYETIAAIGTVFLYLSYVLPVAAGFFAYGRKWKRMGPWSLGGWYRPLAAIATLGCVFLLVLGVQPPNQQAVPVVGGMAVLMVIVWFGLERRRFRGPPVPEGDDRG